MVGMDSSVYAQDAYKNDVKLGARVSLDAASIQAAFPNESNIRAFTSLYMNRDGGWSHATAGTTALLSKVRNLGGRVIGGKEVASLLFDEKGEVSGVKFVDGEERYAGLIVVATGAWTPSLFPAADLGLVDRLTATGWVYDEFGNLYKRVADTLRKIVSAWAQFNLMMNKFSDTKTVRSL